VAIEGGTGVARRKRHGGPPVENRAPVQFIKPRNVSNIDHRLWNPEEHGGSITAPYRHPPVTESAARSRPNAGKCHATSLFFVRPVTHTHRAPALFALHVAHDAGAPQSGSDGFEHRRFECPKCSSVQNEVVASDPMKSASVGWLAGELRAPN
jgi:hypothetical protein